MVKKTKQLKLLKDQPKAYGGELLKTRAGRLHGRPLDTKRTMHLVLRSSRATGEMSFWKPKNKLKVQAITQKFSKKYAVKILSLANVGNHLHLHIKLSNRYTYASFIRAITGTIAMAITGVNRWNRPQDQVKGRPQDRRKECFWDYRPFSRVVVGLRALLNLRDYIEINRLEGFGFQRPQARFFLKWNQLSLGP